MKRLICQGMWLLSLLVSVCQITPSRAQSADPAPALDVLDNRCQVSTESLLAEMTDLCRLTSYRIQHTPRDNSPGTTGPRNRLRRTGSPTAIAVITCVLKKMTGAKNT